jgi:hypothetical protein
MAQVNSFRLTVNGIEIWLSFESALGACSINQNGQSGSLMSSKPIVKGRLSGGIIPWSSLLYFSISFLMDLVVRLICFANLVVIDWPSEKSSENIVL